MTKNRQDRIELFLRDKEVFLDLGDKNLSIKRKLTKLGCKVLLLPINLTSETSIFISSQCLQHHTRKCIARYPVDLLLKHTRTRRKIQMLDNFTRPSASRSTSQAILLKALELNPNVKFYYYPEIKEQLDREVQANHPHEYRFNFDISPLKKTFPNACQYFITDAKGVHKIKPHIIEVPPTLSLDHPCAHRGSHFAKPWKQVGNKRRRKFVLDIKSKARKKPKRKVCDGCLRRYTDLDMHNKSKEHQQWYKSENFEDIDKFINLVARKREEEGRLRGETKDQDKGMAQNEQKVKQNEIFSCTQEVEQELEHVASPLYSEDDRNFWVHPSASLSSVSDTTESTGSDNSSGITTEMPRGLETSSWPKKGDLHQPSLNEEPSKAKIPETVISCVGPINGISEMPKGLRSMSIHFASQISFINTERKIKLPYYSPKSSSDPLSSSLTKFKTTIKEMNRKRDEEQEITPVPMWSPQVAKAAVSSSSECITSQEQSCKLPFPRNLRILQRREIKGPRIHECKSRSAKRIKREEVNAILYRLSGSMKPKSDDKKRKLHHKLLTLAEKRSKDGLKLSIERNLLLIPKPVATNSLQYKLTSPPIESKKTFSKRLQGEKHTCRYNNVVVQRQNQTPKRRSKALYPFSKVKTVKRKYHGKKKPRTRKSSM